MVGFCSRHYESSLPTSSPQLALTTSRWTSLRTIRTWNFSASNRPSNPGLRAVLVAAGRTHHRPRRALTSTQEPPVRPGAAVEHGATLDRVLCERGQAHPPPRLESLLGGALSSDAQAALPPAEALIKHFSTLSTGRISPSVCSDGQHPWC